MNISGALFGEGKWGIKVEMISMSLTVASKHTKMSFIITVMPIFHISSRGKYLIRNQYHSLGSPGRPSFICLNRWERAIFIYTVQSSVATVLWCQLKPNQYWFLQVPPLAWMTASTEAPLAHDCHSPEASGHWFTRDIHGIWADLSHISNSLVMVRLLQPNKQHWWMQDADTGTNW